MTFERKIRHALVWMRAAAFADGLACGSVVAAALLLAAVLVAKAAAPRIPWLWVWGAAAGAAMLWALALYILHRPRIEHAALRLDEAHGLKERFITALHALRSEHEFNELIIADAERHAPNVVPRRAAQARVRRPLTGAAFLCVAAGAAFLFLPEMDLLGRKAVAAAREQSKVAVKQEARKLDELQKKLTEPRKDAPLPEETTKLAKEIADLQKQFAREHAPGARDAMAKLSSLAEKVGQQKDALKKRADTTPKSAASKPQETGGMTSRLERALRRGDLEMAKAELSRLQERSTAPGTSATQAANLGEELKKLAESVEGQQAFSAALADAGDALAKADTSAAKAGFDKAKDALTALDKLQAEAAKLDAALGEIEKSKAQLAAAASNEAKTGAGKGSMGSGGGACPNCGESSCSGNCQGKPGGKGDTDKPGSGKEKQGQPGREGSAAKFEVGSTGKGSPGSGQGEAADAGEATAGESSGDGKQSGGEGQGSSSALAGTGSGKGKGNAKGNGQGSGPDWGIGTTNLGAEQGYNAQEKAGEDRYAQGRDSKWTEQFIQLYAARKTDTKQYNTRAKGQMGEGKFDYSVDVSGEARREAPQADVTRAFMDFREAQKDALAKEDIPVGYKNFVKNYFDSIEPPK